MSKSLNLDFEANDWLITQNQETRKLLSNPLLQKDIWQTIEDLGLKVNQHDKVLTISFQAIEQKWLKLLAKLYVLVRSQRNLSPSYLRSDVFNLSKFSHFIQQKSILNLEQINHKLFEELDYYLQSLKLSPMTIKLH